MSKVPENNGYDLTVNTNDRKILFVPNPTKQLVTEHLADVPYQSIKKKQNHSLGKKPTKMRKIAKKTDIISAKK